MNHIKKLQHDNKELRLSLEQLMQEVIELQRYYSSEKFASVENDYAHVSTDVQIKISNLKSLVFRAQTI